MSRFFSKKYASLVPYVPGEQPKNMKYNKLNTNESPFPPSPKAISEAAEVLKHLQLYSDPECSPLVLKLSEVYGVSKDRIICNNGSDETLNFAFMAFCDEEHPAVFPDITYGFYPVFAEINHVPYETIPLKEDMSVGVEDYLGINKTIFLANPNAPTGIALRKSEIEKILKSNPDNVVIVDEAYVDFGAESCVSLIDQYDNLLVIQTFSKSRSLAGARLGFAFGSSELIRDLNTIRFSTNPYNVNSATMAAGVGALSDEDYTRKNAETIMNNRLWTVTELKKLGFLMTDSLANFIFATHPQVDGEYLYKTLKERGILVRHFTVQRISQYNRISIGSMDQMVVLVETIKQILSELGISQTVN